MLLGQMFAKDSKGVLAIRARAFVHLSVSELLSFYFPRRVVRDVHSGVAAFTSERGHRIAGKRLFARNTRILPSTSGNEMSTATHIRLRLVDIARIES